MRVADILRTGTSADHVVQHPHCFIVQFRKRRQHRGQIRFAGEIIGTADGRDNGNIVRNTDAVQTEKVHDARSHNAGREDQSVRTLRGRQTENLINQRLMHFIIRTEAAGIGIEKCDLFTLEAKGFQPILQ